MMDETTGSRESVEGVKIYGGSNGFDNGIALKRIGDRRLESRNIHGA
jgi:hypothetical protein